MTDQVFVKYCPLCGAENPRQQAFCLACMDGDLTVVSVEVRRARDVAPADGTAVIGERAGQTATSVRTERRSDRRISTRQVVELATLTLECIEDPALRFVVEEGQTVGRTDKADVVLRGVPKLDWISSAHARFFRRGEQWYVQHIGATNFVKVDGETYRGREEVTLQDGAIVVFSLTAFRVLLEGCGDADCGGGM